MILANFGRTAIHYFVFFTKNASNKVRQLPNVRFFFFFGITSSLSFPFIFLFLFLSLSLSFSANKNRLCSKTCGVDIDIEDKKDQAKIEGFFS